MDKELEKFEEVENLDDEELEIVLTLEDDSEINCKVIAIYAIEDGKFKDNQYIALGIEDSEDILIYGYKENDDEDFELIPLEDDEELQAASDALDILFEEDLCDDGDCCDCGCSSCNDSDL